MSDEIFISYANEDEARVEPLARLLEAEGWSVWWDRDIPVGRTFDEVIEEALDAARCVIVVWTEESVASRWVKTEAGEGAARNILVPVLLDDVRIPLAFRRIQAADLVGWEGEQQHPGVEQLVEAVSRVAGSPKREAPEREEEDEPPRTVVIAPELEGQAEAIPDEIASEEEAVREHLEEQPDAPPPGDHVAPPEAPEEESAPPEKRVPAGLER